MRACPSLQTTKKPVKGVDTEAKEKGKKFTEKINKGTPHFVSLCALSCFCSVLSVSTLLNFMV